MTDSKFPPHFMPPPSALPGKYRNVAGSVVSKSRTKSPLQDSITRKANRPALGGRLRKGVPSAIGQDPGFSGVRRKTPDDEEYGQQQTAIAHAPHQHSTKRHRASIPFSRLARQTQGGSTQSPS